MPGTRFGWHSQQHLQPFNLAHCSNEMISHHTRLIPHNQWIAHQRNAKMQMTGDIFFHRWHALLHV
jgi:hypothetical protein